jgi:Uma2 family endonuclease
MGTTKTLLTFAEFERLPDQPGKLELLKGELIELPPPELTHDRTSRRIFRRLDTAVAEAHARGEAGELGEVCIETGYQLDRNSWVRPDVSVAHAHQPEGQYFEGAPAIAIEVVSPSNTADELAAKTRLYFQHGAREVWRVYQKAQYVEVHVPGGSREVLLHESLTTPLLPGFSMPVTELLGE